MIMLLCMLEHLFLRSLASDPCLEPSAPWWVRTYFARLNGITSVLKVCIAEASCLLLALGGIHPLCFGFGIRFFAILLYQSLILFFFRLPQFRAFKREFTADKKSVSSLVRQFGHLLPSVAPRKCLHITMKKFLCGTAFSAETERPIC